MEGCASALGDTEHVRWPQISVRKTTGRAHDWNAGQAKSRSCQRLLRCLPAVIDLFLFAAAYVNVLDDVVNNTSICAHVILNAAKGIDADAQIADGGSFPPFGIQQFRRRDGQCVLGRISNIEEL